jgi:hypothetical protein
MPGRQESGRDGRAAGEQRPHDRGAIDRGGDGAASLEVAKDGAVVLKEQVGDVGTVRETTSARGRCRRQAGRHVRRNRCTGEQR